MVHVYDQGYSNVYGQGLLLIVIIMAYVMVMGLRLWLSLWLGFIIEYYSYGQAYDYNYGKWLLLE